MSKSLYFIQDQEYAQPNDERNSIQILHDLIEPVCQKLDYTLTYSSEVPLESRVEPVASKLSTSHLVIADLTQSEWSQSVLLEIGFRIATGRPLVLLIATGNAIKKLPDILSNSIVCCVNASSPKAADLERLCQCIATLPNTLGWHSNFPIIEFSLPLDDPASATFVYANERAAQLYGYVSADELISAKVDDADAKLMTYMSSEQRQAFVDDQRRMFGAIFERGNQKAVMADVPVWFKTHPFKANNGQSYWPLLLQHKSSEFENNTLVMRLAFINVSAWDAYPPRLRDFSSVRSMPGIFREPLYKYDVFLSYNSLDREVAQTVKSILQRCGLRVWYDEDNLNGGLPFFAEIERAIYNSLTIVMLLGTNGLGPWQDSVELQNEFLTITKDGKQFVTLMLDNLNNDDNPDFWQQFVPTEFRTLIKNQLFVQLPEIKVLREFINPARPPLFAVRLIKFFSESLRRSNKKDSSDDD